MFDVCWNSIADPEALICPVCGGSGTVPDVTLFGRPSRRACGPCEGRGDLQKAYTFDPEEYAYWRGVYDRQRRLGPPRQPRHLRQQARSHERSLPILSRLLASVVRAIR